MWARATFVTVAFGASTSAACVEPTPPMEEPPVVAPVIPWLASGELEIADPVIPWMDGGDGDPVTRPCAAGWTRRESPAGAICDPWPEGGRPHCEGATAVRPGESACTPIGRACPASGEFAEDLPVDALFVREGAGGTGTREAPFGTLAEALAVASPGATIALARGALAVPLDVDVAVTLRGACAEETRLTGPLTISAAVTLEDVTVTSASSAIVVQRGGLTARGVVVGDHVGSGIDLRSAENVLEDVVVRGGTGATATFEGAVHVVNATLEATRLVIEGRAGFGLTVDSRASLTLSDSVVADGSTSDRGPTALVLLLAASTRTDISRCVVENGVNQLLAVNGGAVTIEDTLVQGARIQPGQAIAIGVTGFGGSLTTRGLRTHDIDGFGLATAGGYVEVEDYVADGTHPMSVGLHAEEGSTMVARRARLGPIAIGARSFVRGALELEDARFTGATQASMVSSGEESVGTFRRVFVHDGVAGLRVGSDATAELSDAIFTEVRGTGIGDDAVGAYLRSRVVAQRVRATGMGNSCFAALQDAVVELSDARCVDAELGIVSAIRGSMTARRVSVEDITLVGLVSEESASLVVEDATVRGVGPTEAVSAGLAINEGATATLSRVTISEIDGYGVSSWDGDELGGDPEVTPHLILTDVLVDGATIGGFSANGLVDLDRVEIRRAGVAAITHTSPTTVFQVRDVHIVDTVPDPIDGRFGHGVHLVTGGTMRGTHVVVEGARGAGLLARGATVELDGLWVSTVVAASCGAGCLGGGSGIVANEGAVVRLANVRSFGNEVAGVQVVGAATSVTLLGGWIHDNAIGRNLGSALDATPLLGVTYAQNGVEEDRRDLAPPALTLF